MNILIVCEVDYLRHVVYELQEIPELLTLRGHNVCVIDYESDWAKTKLTDLGNLRPTSRITSRVHHQCKIELIRPPIIKIPIVSRCVAFATYYPLFVRALLTKKIDVVILYSAPTNGVQTILAAKKLRVPVVFRSIDVLHKLVARPLALPTKMAESWVYRHVDKILTITPALSRYVTKLGANPAKVRILPLGIDTRPLSETTGAKSTGLWGETGIIYRTMVFAGTLPTFSGLDTLISRMPGLVARIPSLRLLIVGDGVQRPKLEQMITELGLGECVKITGIVPHEDVPKWIAGADIGVLTFPASGVTRDIFPTKVLQYMACGKPVVANPLPGLVEYGLGEEQGVMYVKNGDWASAILNALVNKDVLSRMARKYVEREHGYDKVVSLLERELETLDRIRRAK